MTAAPPRGLLHPGALIAIGLLILNDHWLKDVYPGIITGKLSDFAGLAFFPLVLHGFWMLVIGRDYRRALSIACVLTAAAFAAVKTVPACHTAYEVGLGWLQFPFRALLGATEPAKTRLEMDATDLVALPAVSLAWWWGRTSRQDALDSPRP